MLVRMVKYLRTERPKKNPVFSVRKKKSAQKVAFLHQETKANFRNQCRKEKLFEQLTLK